MAEGARITIYAQLQFRHDVEANWLAADPILKVGEPAYTIGYSDRFKLGDGQSKWSELPYLQLGGGGGGGGSQAYESLAWSAIKTLTSGEASVLAQAYAVKQAYTELKSLIPNLADYYTKEQINALIPSLEGYATEAWVLDKGYATESFVNTKIADLINGAPSTLDTLKEIADAFAQSQDVIEALDEAIGKKASQSDLTALAARVAANEGNITSLSSNKLDKSIWDSVFEIDAKGNLRAKVGIYSTSFISARTSDPSAGGGSGGGGAFSLYTWDQVKAMTAEVGGVAPTAYALKQAYNELINATPTLSWNNISDKPIFANVATSGSYSDLIGRPTALSDLANDVGYITASAIPSTYAWSAISGKPNTLAGYGITDAYTASTIDNKLGGYLPLSGGTITGDTDALKILRNSGGYSAITYYNTQDGVATLLGVMGFGANGEPSAYRAFDNTWRTLIHSGNIGSQSVNYATSAGNANALKGISANNYAYYNPGGNGAYLAFNIIDYTLAPYGQGDKYIEYYDNGAYYNSVWGWVMAINGFKGNADSATKLATARTIWGQSFDGTGDVNGNLNIGYNKLYIGDGSDNFYIGWGSSNMFAYNNYYGHYFTTNYTTRMLINSAGNVGIGTTSPSEKLSVAGNITASGTIYSAVGMYSPGYISARSTAGSSDRNLKTNIAPVRNALAYILGTKYVSFDWKDTGEHSVGIIAQDELNREWSCLVQKYNELYSYQYTQHTALIGSALQEEDKKVEALKAEVATLKNKVQKLERQLWQQ